MSVRLLSSRVNLFPGSVCTCNGPMLFHNSATSIESTTNGGHTGVLPDELGRSVTRDAGDNGHPKASHPREGCAHERAKRGSANVPPSRPGGY
jgi:hypothetical protein